MKQNSVQVSDSRQYVACTSKDVLVRFSLPNGVLINNLVHAGYYFYKYLNPGETILWLTAYENIEDTLLLHLSAVDLPVFILEGGRRVETAMSGADLIEEDDEDLEDENWNVAGFPNIPEVYDE